MSRFCRCTTRPREEVPLFGVEEVDRAMWTTVQAFEAWGRTPLMERVRLMFRYKRFWRSILKSSIERNYGKTLEEAVVPANRGTYRNMALILPAQPFPCYPFSGWRASFFGDLHSHGPDAFTRRKVVEGW